MDIGSPPRKISRGRQFTGKNPSRPGGRRAGRIFAGKLSAEGDLKCDTGKLCQQSSAVTITISVDASMIHSI